MCCICATSSEEYSASWLLTKCAQRYSNASSPSSGPWSPCNICYVVIVELFSFSLWWVTFVLCFGGEIGFPRVLIEKSYCIYCCWRMRVLYGRYRLLKLWCKMSLLFYFSNVISDHGHKVLTSGMHDCCFRDIIPLH